MKTRILLLLLIIFISNEACAQSGIYVGGHFRRSRQNTVTDLKNSGFTYAILFNVNVEPNGDLTTDGETIVSNGNYVFGNTQPNYIADVNALKTGVTSINRLEYCVGGWGNTSYANIRSLVNSQGTGTGSILYRNFRALKLAIPTVDAINNDDEHTYDVNSATAFHVMLADIGFRTTLAPYMNRPYWQSLATNVNNQRGGTVDRIYLQWYEGGAGNNPCDWRINNIEMHTGDLNYENSTNMINKMTSAKNNCGSKGGFLWVYNDNGVNLKELATRINAIFGIRNKSMQEVANFYNDCNFQGFANGLGVGDYNMSQLQSMGIGADQISGLTVAEGFEVVLYNGGNFDAESQVFSGSKSCLVADGWNDRAASMRIRTKGVTGITGTYYLQNRNSGLNMDVHGGTTGTGDGVNIQQWNVSTTPNQQFEFTHLGNGAYKIIAKHSGKSIDVDDAKKNNGTNVQQWTYGGSFNQQFVLVDAGGDYYKILAKHSGKMVEVAGCSKNPEANVQQWDNNNQTCGMWKLVPITVVNGNGDGLTANYFNGMNFETPVVSRKETSINLNWNSASPAAGVNADLFSARYTGQIQPRYSGAYTFYINSDNGRRLWINNQLIIDKWVDDLTEYSGTINLTAGQKYDIRLDYFENVGGANLKLEWTSPLQAREVVPQSQLYSNALPAIAITAPTSSSNPTAPATVDFTVSTSDADGSIAKVEFYNGSTKLGESSAAPFSFSWKNAPQGTHTLTARATDNRGGVSVSASVVMTIKPAVINGDGLTANYFNGMNFETPVLSRKDASPNFSWNSGSPAAGVNADQFSVRWTGQIQTAYTEAYTFYINSDNGRRVWINDQLLIDKWIDNWNIEYTGTINLTAGQKYNIRVDYFENNGGADIKLEWSSASQARQLIPQTALFSNPLPSVSITAPANNASFTAPANINISANVADNSGISKVEFYNGATKLGEDITSPYSFAWNSVAAGNYSITARAFDNLNAVTVSSVITANVTTVVQNQAPTVSITGPANNANYNAPASITFTANAADNDGTISKVEFFNGATSIGSDNTSPYSIAWNNVAAGTYTITAKATDNASATTTSPAITVKVNTVVQNQVPTVSITGPANNTNYNAPANITFTANAVDNDGTISKVEFFNGAASIGSDNTSPYSITWSNVAAGTYTITAKATDNSNAITTSTSITVKVNTVTAGCTVPQYVENSGYVAGSKVKNAGRQYECKEFPYSGWCNGAAWAYGPGTGAYWTDAWYDRGTCAGRIGEDAELAFQKLLISPNPTSDEITIHLEQESIVTVMNAHGQIAIVPRAIESNGKISLGELPSGIYLIKIEAGGAAINKTVVKQ